jgi:hypothetical protein
MNQTVQPKAHVKNPSTTTTNQAPHSAGAEESGGQTSVSYDADSLDDVPRVKLKKRGWTLGNSAKLVEGTDSEPLWVTIGWIAVPTAVFALFLLAMMNT